MKYISTIIWAVVFIGVVIYNFKIKAESRQKEEDLNTQLAQSQYQLSRTKGLYIKHLELERNEINLDSLKALIANQKVRLSDGTVVLRFFQQNCKDCITKIFQTVNKYDKVVVMTNYNNPRQLNLLVKELKIKSPIIVVQDLFKDESSVYPYLFMIRKNKAINYFMPNEDLPELTDSYIRFSSQQ